VKPRTVLLTGGDGQLSSDLRLVWPVERPADRLVALAHADLDVTDPASVDAALAAHRPDLVINTAAYNNVDRAEAEPAPALAVNATGPRNLAGACERAGAVLMHISTDFVFSGRGRRRGQPYEESEAVEPLSVYAVSKAAGEMLVRAGCRRHVIVRVSGLYGASGARSKGGSFVQTMLRLAGAGGPVRVVDDQVLTPSSTRAVARQLAVLSEVDEPGTYHATCQGECSWFEFAAEIFRQAGAAVDLQPQSTADTDRPARRPSYSALDNARLRELGIDRMPDWRDALAEFLAATGSVRH
jgi:dTDP-4-dehydrorhamnose reductase